MSVSNDRLQGSGLHDVLHASCLKEGLMVSYEEAVGQTSALRKYDCK